MVAQYQETGRVDEPGVRVLKRRLRILEDSPILTRDQILETFDMAVVAGEYASAVRMLRKNQNVLDHAKGTDLVTLAEYYYISNDPNSARALLKRVTGQMAELPAGVRKRAIVLNSMLEPGRENYEAQLAALLSIRVEDASLTLQKEKAKLKAAALNVKTGLR